MLAHIYIFMRSLPVAVAPRQRRRKSLHVLPKKHVKIAHSDLFEFNAASQRIRASPPLALCVLFREKERRKTECIQF